MSTYTHPTHHEQELYKKYDKLDFYLAYPPQIVDEKLLDLVADWSLSAYGPGMRTEGIIKHIESELVEIRQEPGDLEEWVDVILLALNGASRTGANGADIIRALKKKIRKNAERVWPDWRTVDPNKPIEHIK